MSAVGSSLGLESGMMIAMLKLLIVVVVLAYVFGVWLKGFSYLKRVIMWAWRWLGGSGV